MALRHLLSLLFFTFTLYATPHDFKACQLKYQVSSLQVGQTQGFAVDKGYALFYSATPPKSGFIKRDPFLGLNLVKSTKPFKHLFKFYSNRPDKLAAVLPKGAVEGKLISKQIGLDHLAQFSEPTEKNALISGSCCGVVGLSTSEGIIEKEYIQHFLKSKEVIYSDIGVRLTDEKGVRVVEVNPFFESSPFLLKDKILSMDGKGVISAAQLSREILFSKPETRHHFLVLREGKELKLEAVFKKRLSGGLISDGFLEPFGLKLDEELIAKEENAKGGIKKGDQLLMVMGEEVETLSQVRAVLSKEKGSPSRQITLLLRRDGFDFFLHIAKH